MILLVAALAGCNQIYGLEQTQLRDAPGPDAPYRCDGAAPDFRGTPVLVVGEPTSLRSYSVSIDRRIAVGERLGTLYEGPADSAMVTGALLSPAPSMTPGSPRLAPEGDELFVRYINALMTTSPTTIDRYMRQGDLWLRAGTVLPLMAAGADISAPTRRDAGPRRMLVLVSITELREYVETAPDQWMQVTSYTPNDLGSVEIHAPNLTPDGLHLVFEGRDASNSPTLVYASRASVAERFVNPVNANPFFGSPRITDPFIDETCSRMYFFVPSKPFGTYYVGR